jgi:hypothetical protein
MPYRFRIFSFFSVRKNYRGFSIKGVVPTTQETNKQEEGHPSSTHAEHLTEAQNGLLNCIFEFLCVRASFLLSIIAYIFSVPYLLELSILGDCLTLNTVVMASLDVSEA